MTNSNQAYFRRQSGRSTGTTSGERPISDVSTFKQPTKAAARQASLRHAVELLTSRREHAAIVPKDYVRRVRTALLKSDVYGYADAVSMCSSGDIASWQEFWAQSVGTREPGDLTVAYFAGPEPSNDLLTFLELGLRPENIWAFEMRASTIEAGLSDIERLNLRGVKFIPVSINRYFEGTPRRFDIIYIDACAPLPSPAQGTVKLIVDIFRFSALAPLGVLVTNFAKPDISKEKEIKRFSHLIASYLYPKGFMESSEGGMVEGPTAQGYLMPGDFVAEEESDELFFSEDECFVNEVRKNFEQHYGAFITRHLMDIAAIIAPTARLMDSELFRILFSGAYEDAAKRARRFVRPNPLTLSEDYDWESDDFLEFDGEAGSDPSFYSLLWTLAECGQYGNNAARTSIDADILEFERQWLNHLRGSRPRNIMAEEVIAAFYAWRHDKTFWSDAMRKIAEFPYRERMPFLCDVPTDEIGFYPAFAQLAYPAHANVRETKRLRYIAEGKKTEMFMDVLAFDECRYVYDWLSALHLVPGDWEDMSAQLTFRFALDGVAKNTRWFWDDFLFGCHAVGESEDFPTGELAPRQNLSPKPDSILTDCQD